MEQEEQEHVDTEAEAEVLPVGNTTATTPTQTEINGQPLPVPQINFDAFAVPPPVDDVLGKRKRDGDEDDDQDRPDISAFIEEQMSKRELIAIIMKCCNDWPDKTKHIMKECKITLSKLPYLPKKDIEGLLKLIKFDIGSQSTNIITKYAAEVANNAVEKILCAAGADVEGMSQLCLVDPDFRQIWNELSIEYLHLIHVEPKWRLLMYWGKMAYLTHQQNSSRRRVKQKLDEPLENHVNEEEEEENLPEDPGSDEENDEDGEDVGSE